MKINNKDLIQSYILTSAKYSYSVYEKRILYRIIEILQEYTSGKKLNQKYHIQETIFDDVDVTMPIHAFLKDEKDNNYSRAKKALLSLNKKVITYEDSKTWGAFNLIERPEINKVGDSVSFRISPTIARAFIDFSKGYSKYELSTAMEFESVYAMRFYELLSEQKKPITYSIESLKIMFQLEGKYKLPADFIRSVIETAKRELDEKSPYSFEFKPQKTGRAITSLKFYPIYQPKNRDMRIEAKKLSKSTSLRWDLDVIIINYLKQNYIFSDEEINNNRELFVQAQESVNFDLLLFLSAQRITAEQKSNPKGWIIGAIKKQLSQAAPPKKTKSTKTLARKNTEAQSVDKILKNIIKPVVS